MSRYADRQYNIHRKLAAVLREGLRRCIESHANASQITRVYRDVTARREFKELSAYYQGMLWGAWGAMRDCLVEPYLTHAYPFRWYDVPAEGVKLEHEDGKVHAALSKLTIVREEWLDLSEYKPRMATGERNGNLGPAEGRDLDYPINMHTIVKPHVGYMVEDGCCTVWTAAKAPGKTARERLHFVSDTSAVAVSLPPTYPAPGPEEPVVMHMYEVFSLDVWGNALNGYDINDWHRVGTVEIPSNVTDDADILRILRKADYLGDHVTARCFEVEDPSCDGHNLTIVDNRQPRLVKRDETAVTHGHGRPILKLRRVEQD